MLLRKASGLQYRLYTSDILKVKAFIQRYLLRPLGRAYKINTLDPDTDGTCVGGIIDQQSPEFAVCSQWDLQGISLRPGWYMLEVTHSADSIGCTLSVEKPNGDFEYLLLTSKRVCKRIVRLETRLNHCVVRLNQRGCMLGSVCFTPLTNHFAISRLRRRLKNRGSNKLPDEFTTNQLYLAYRAQLHDVIFPVAYTYEPCDVDDKGKLSIYEVRQRSAIRLLLVTGCDKTHNDVDRSVEAALRFGCERGWQIEWYAQKEIVDEDLDKINFDGTVFAMPILPSVEYRIDIFHQMLNAVQNDTRLVYADHDYLDTDGAHINPVLKPEWNPELLLNTDYIQLPWMVSGVWGRVVLIESNTRSADVNGVLLRASLGAKLVSTDSNALQDDKPALRTAQVVRVPLVLASVQPPEAGRALSPFSTASSWQRCVAEALRDAGSSAELVDSRYTDKHRILWPLASQQPSVDIIIPTRDKVSVLKTCIESIFSKTDYANFRLIIVDNDSQNAVTEDYYQILLNDPRCHVLRYSGSFNYSAINNFAARHSQADVLVLLNNDTEVRSTSWLDEMVRQAMRPEIGCVGAKLYYSNGRVQHGGVIVGIMGVAGHAHRYSAGDADGYCGRLTVSQNLSAVTAACLAVRRSTWAQAGGLDEVHLGVAWNDVDFCLKVQCLGFKNVWTPHAELFHHEGLSRGADDTPEKIRRVDAERQTMLDRWGLEGVTDPAYHPSLTRENESFSLGKTIS